jgi:hypothetical protein
MIKEDIIRMAKEAGFHIGARRMFTARDIDIERFANLVAAAEREACAKLCEKEAGLCIDSYEANGMYECAEVIRERGQ